MKTAKPDDLVGLLATLHVPSVRVTGERQPELQARLGVMAADADALAVEFPERAAELGFLAGYIRRMLMF